MKNLINTNNSNLTIFNFEADDVRVVIQDNEPLFCLSDICKVLELTTPAKVKEAILKEFELYELNSYSFDTGFGVKELNLITEQQLYYMLMRSDKPKAKPFRQWVYNEVLPTIRKTGKYNIINNINTHAGTLKELSRVALELSNALEKIEQDAPKVDTYDKFFDKSQYMTGSDVFKVIKSHNPKVKQSDIFNYLKNHKIFYKHKGDYCAYATAIDNGLAVNKNIVIEVNGENKDKVYGYLTGKGAEKVIKYFTTEKIKKSQKLLDK